MALHIMKKCTKELSNCAYDDIFNEKSATKPLNKFSIPENESDPKEMYRLI